MMHSARFLACLVFIFTRAIFHVTDAVDSCSFENGRCVYNVQLSRGGGTQGTCHAGVANTASELIVDMIRNLTGRLTRNTDANLAGEIADLRSTVNALVSSVSSVMSQIQNLESWAQTQDGNPLTTTTRTPQPITEDARSTATRTPRPITEEVRTTSLHPHVSSRTTQGGEPRTCAPEFTEFHGSCYFMSNAFYELSRDLAHRFCDQKGAKLVSIETDEEWSFVRTVLLRKSAQGGVNWWTSGYLTTDGIWTWRSTGQRVDRGYNQWGEREPNGSGTCLGLWRSNNFLYTDVNCDVTGYGENHGYICEY